MGDIMKHELIVIKEIIKMAVDCHLHDWSKLQPAFDGAFGDLESRFERLERAVAKLEAERRTDA